MALSIRQILPKMSGHRKWSFDSLFLTVLLVNLLEKLQTDSSHTGSVRTAPLPSLTKSTASNGREVNGIADQADYEDCQESATALPPSARSNTSVLIDSANPCKYATACCAEYHIEVGLIIISLQGVTAKRTCCQHFASLKSDALLARST